MPIKCIFWYMCMCGCVMCNAWKFPRRNQACHLERMGVCTTMSKTHSTMYLIRKKKKKIFFFFYGWASDNLTLSNAVSLNMTNKSQIYLRFIATAPQLSKKTHSYHSQLVWSTCCSRFDFNICILIQILPANRQNPLFIGSDLSDLFIILIDAVEMEAYIVFHLSTSYVHLAKRNSNKMSNRIKNNKWQISKITILQEHLFVLSIKCATISFLWRYYFRNRKKTSR